MLLPLPAANVAVLAAPLTSSDVAAVWVIAPAVVALKFPETVALPKFKALASRNVTSLPLVITTVVKSLPLWSRVMLLPLPAANGAEERRVVTSSDVAAAWVIAPAVVTLKFPDTVALPKFKALASRNVTLLPMVITTVVK